MMPGESSVTASTETESATIDADIPCAGCRYNLRGLQADGKCPECAGSIVGSIAEHRKGVPRQLVAEARRSVQFMLAAIATALAGGAIPGWIEGNNATWHNFFVWLILISWGWSAISMWVAASAEPEPRRLIRKWLCW